MPPRLGSYLNETGHLKTKFYHFLFQPPVNEVISTMEVSTVDADLQ